MDYIKRWSRCTKCNKYVCDKELNYIIDIDIKYSMVCNNCIDSVIEELNKLEIEKEKELYDNNSSNRNMW